MLEPRWYQKSANDSAWKFLAERDGNPLIVLPTGAGKSLVIAMLVRQAREFGGRVVDGSGGWYVEQLEAPK